MVERRKASRKHRPSFCPACDARLAGELALEPVTRCPQCKAALVPVRAAGAWRRALAGAVDIVVLLVTAGVLNWGLLVLLDPPPLTGDARGLDAMLRLLEISPWDVIARITPALVMAALYFGLFWTATGRTPGQRVFRLRVVGRRGAPPSIVRAAIRVVGKFAALVPGGLGWIWVAFDREKRGWHDHLAGTYVITES